MANELVQVPFHGDIIEATQDDQGNVWVPIRRPCEALGLAPNNQIEKLKKKSWATDMIIISVAEDGKSREMYALHLDCLPMWLATIDANRVKEEFRAKLELYQKEAARVLANHFLGRGAQTASYPPSFDPTQMVAVIASTVAKVLAESFATVKPIADLVTVDNRCQERWPTATAKHRRRVRDVAIGIYRERLGRHPLKLTGHLNGVIAFEREHLSILDRAIDIVIEQATGWQVAPLFMRPSVN